MVKRLRPRDAFYLGVNGLELARETGETMSDPEDHTQINPEATENNDPIEVLHWAFHDYFFAVGHVQLEAHRAKREAEDWHGIPVIRISRDIVLSAQRLTRKSRGAPRHLYQLISTHFSAICTCGKPLL